MRQKKKVEEAEIRKVQRWFARSVKYEGEPYVMDAEQVRAVMDDSFNAIVVARAGSGKTRTIVAKIVYLIARKGVKPEEIMVFVFNANAAREINERLMKMTVDGKLIVGKRVVVARTFHAFSRYIVYDVCRGREKCGKILADGKGAYVLAIVKKMMLEEKWRKKIGDFLGEKAECKFEISAERGKVIEGIDGFDRGETERFAMKMTQFINRAQQKFLAGEKTLWGSIRERYEQGEVGQRERLFIQLGAECYRRYHWYLLDEAARAKLIGFEGYGTDFNLLVSWASKLIKSDGEEVQKMLVGKKYVLIDEYQDFSQLFLSVVLAIREIVPEARLFVVGDDWQAINRFAGSDVGYFKEFERYFNPARRYEITTNYRCDREIVGRARTFMKKAMGEKGEFRASSRRVGRVMMVDARRTKVQYLETLVKLIKKNRKMEDILILHRNNETGLKISLVGLKAALKREIVKAGVLDGKEFDAKVRVMTMHKSKGLEAETVIILEADEGVMSREHPDTQLYMVFGETEEVALADQKRLFYVAMTRAKKRLYIMHDFEGKSGFIKYLGKGVERWGE